MGGVNTLRWLETTSSIYNQITFNTDAVFNNPAPAFWISFAVGGALSICGAVLWLLRVIRTKKEIEKMDIPFNGIIMLQSLIARAIDNDDPAYVVISFSAISFLFLGGLQLNYQWTYFVMIAFYGLSSLGDTIRILLVVCSATSMADVVQTSSLIDAKLRKEEATLKPSNVYEDLGKGKTIVVMVFITQVILVGFVGLDIYQTPTTNCFDGTKGCPVVGTLGSWALYVLGIFMACVYLLGPKTSYGESEQNPAYWIQLFIAAKKPGAKVTWHDQVENATKTMLLSPNDWRVWMRFVMSFIVNGFAFHLLVHSLPIQIAAQSSLTGVVIRAVGMVYLVDLDDTPGQPLTIVKEKE